MGILVFPLLSEPGNEVLGSRSPTMVVAPATDIEMTKSESKSRSCWVVVGVRAWAALGDCFYSVCLGPDTA